MRMLHTISGIRKTLSLKVVLIAVLWLLGLLAGAYFLGQTSLASLMCSVLFLRISIFGLFLSLALPLILSYILYRFFHFYFILPIVFLKAFSFICCYGSLMIVYRNAGWLVSGMILFSDFSFVVLLLLYWYNAATGRSYSARIAFAVYFLIPIVVGCIDYYIVSPYAAMLLNY